MDLVAKTGHVIESQTETKNGIMHNFYFLKKKKNQVNLLWNSSIRVGRKAMAITNYVTHPS